MSRVEPKCGWEMMIPTIRCFLSLKSIRTDWKAIGVTVGRCKLVARIFEDYLNHCVVSPLLIKDLWRKKASCGLIKSWVACYHMMESHSIDNQFLYSIYGTAKYWMLVKLHIDCQHYQCDCHPQAGSMRTRGHSSNKMLSVVRYVLSFTESESRSLRVLHKIVFLIWP